MAGKLVKGAVRRAALILLVLAAATTAASAQDVTTLPDTTATGHGVMDRARPDYDAKGLPMGGFRLFPKLDVSGGYDDNVLRLDTATRDSGFTRELASALLASNWNRHSLSLYGNVDAIQFSDLSSENTTDWTVGGNGRLDIQNGSAFNGNVMHSHLHEPRNSPELPGFAATPTEYDLTHASGALVYNPYHFGFRVGGTYDRYDYDPTAVIAPGAPINNSDRNRNEYDIYARGTYEFSPGYAVFMQGDYVAQDYDQLLDRNGLNRRNSGYRGDVGVSLQISDLLEGEAYVGYLDQNFKAPFRDVSGMNFGAALDWYASDVFTVHVFASRTLVATTLFDAATNDNKVAGLRADFELLPDVILQGGFVHTDSTFKGITRHDQIDNVNIGVNYMLNRYMSANVKYAH